MHRPAVRHFAAPLAALLLGLLTLACHTTALLTGHGTPGAPQRPLFADTVDSLPTDAHRLRTTALADSLTVRNDSARTHAERLNHALDIQMQWLALIGAVADDPNRTTLKRPN